MSKNIFFLALGAGLSTLGLWALAGVSLPHTFSAGGLIRASEVNANFAALNNALPGVAQTAASDTVAITDTTPAVASVTINVPGPGYVKVSATAQLNVEYTGTSSALFTFAVSNTADTIRPDQDKRISLPAGLPAWTYSYIVSSERVFPVDSAGSKTFYLIAEENSGVQGSVSKRTLTATFLTAMGTVQSP
ncbi:MAG: hypothetical protein RMK51_07515 [Meiothermus sp.]|uniref:hypothetical protein n=1 Tax=Meiothermus sp. TaxID=1955249 RepID=UPI0025DEB4F9|nr:hypothetical protein [Meiothermus sp.]MCS7068173.1 hypothetical protein [Meiothermus sp.]MDW8425765.1 hypothetical protein [Meiothermus sp.]